MNGDELAKFCREVTLKSTQIKEEFIARWLKETGLRATECELVQRHYGDCVTIEIRKKEPQ